MFYYISSVNVMLPKKFLHESSGADSDIDIDTDMFRKSSIDNNIDDMTDCTNTLNHKLHFKQKAVKNPKLAYPSRKKTNMANQKNKSNVEIESGVEITEEMTLNVGNNPDNISESFRNTSKKNCKDFSMNRQPVILATSNEKNATPTKTNPFPKLNAKCNSIIITNTLKNRVYNNGVTIISTLILFLSWMWSLPPFLLGIMTCLCSLSFFHTFYKYLLEYFHSNELLNNTEFLNNNYGAQRVPFSIPNYIEMDICKIPVIEECTPLKSYSVSLTKCKRKYFIVVL